MACSWIGVGSDVAHGGHAGEQLALEPERGERGDLDLGGRPGGLLDVLALGVALVDALAAAALAVSAAAAVTVAVAAALAAAVVAPRGRGRHGGRGSRRPRRSARRARARRPAQPAPRRAPRSRRPACPGRWSAPGVVCVCAPPLWAAPSAPPLPWRRRPPRLRRGFCPPSAGAAPADGARSGRRGWSCRWCWGSQVLSSSTAPYAATPRSPREHANARRGSAVCAGVRLVGGHPRGGQTRLRTGVPFLSEHCPVVTMSGGLLREEGPARGAWGETGSRLLNPTLSGLRFYPQAATPTRRPPSPPEASPPRASWRASPRTSACRRG